MAAASRDDDARDNGPAAKTLFAFASVNAMAHLAGAGLPLGIQKIRNRRPAELYRGAQDLSHRLVQARDLFRFQVRRQTRWMNARPHSRLSSA